MSGVCCYTQCCSCLRMSYTHARMHTYEYILCTYIVSKVTHTDSFRLYLDEPYPNITNLYHLPNKVKYSRKAKTLPGHAIHNGMSPLRPL